MTEAKANLRAQMRSIIGHFSKEKRLADSKKLCTRLAVLPFFQQAPSVLFFAPLPAEIDVWPLLQAILVINRVVALPCYDAETEGYRARRVTDSNTEIEVGQFGIREPVASCVELPLNQIKLALVPGAAFDLQGNRLGRGKGYYDRLLQDFRGIKAAVTFDEQVVAEVPVEKNDVRMDYIVTPTRCVKIER